MTDTASTERVSDERLVEIADNFYRPEIKAMASELQSLRSAASVGVKELEWAETGEGFWKAKDLTGGAYEAMQISTGKSYCSHVVRGYGQEIGTVWPSPDEAKAAAQADYERRIRSALSSVPETEGVGEPVAWGIPFGEGFINLTDDKSKASMWKVHFGNEVVPLYLSPQPAPVSADDGLVAALQAIADLPAGKNEDVMEGHEQAFRAVEALCSEKPHIGAAAPQPPQPVKVDEAMVDRAARALHANSKGKHNHFNPFEDLSAQRILWLREDARAALTAALSHEGEAK